MAAFTLSCAQVLFDYPPLSHFGPDLTCYSAAVAGEVASARVVTAAAALGWEDGAHAGVGLASVAPGWEDFVAAAR